MATNTDPLDLKVEKIKDEIEMIFQTILTSFIERKDALLRRLEERVKLLGNEYTGLMDEYSELLRMRDQMEESLNKNQYFDLRTDMLSPLQTRIKQQEQKIHSEFKLEFTYHGFEHLLTTIENFGDVYFPGDAPRIPSPPPDIPYTDATPATQPTRHAMYHPPVINLSPLAALTIPRPPPNIPKNFLLGNYVQPSRGLASAPSRGGRPSGHRAAGRPSRSTIPAPPPDIPRSFLLGTYTPPSRNANRPSYSRSTTSTSRLRTFFSLIGNQ
eukprot:TRINITY_DN6148_c0_g1_i1.p1 TRINITY_DN6148_c0_g1~~TRINITY_DN6148_c0_g1_i1.p1  ORF type:complete len:279 (+),score=55.15 TRINITY_DN6148_c0_g1_i1:29-838(+)